MLQIMDEVENRRVERCISLPRVPTFGKGQQEGRVG